MSPDLVVLLLEPARPDFSGTPRASIFEPETLVFSKFLRATNVRCAKRPTSKKHRKNQYETHFGAAVHRAQIDQKSFCVGPEKHSATRTHLTSVLGHLGGVPGALLECSWAVLEHPGSSREHRWGVPNASLAVLGASRLLLEALLNRSGDAPIPQDRFWTDFGSILVRFWVDFGCSGRSLARWMARFSCPRKPQR